MVYAFNLIYMVDVTGIPRFTLFFDHRLL